MNDPITSSFKLSFLPRVQCQISYHPKTDEWTIEFLRDGESLGKFSLLHDEMTEENLMKEILECRALQLSSSSAAYEIIEAIYEEIEKMSGTSKVDSEVKDISPKVQELNVVPSVEVTSDDQISTKDESASGEAEHAKRIDEISELSLTPRNKIGEIEISGSNDIRVVIQDTDTSHAFLISFVQHGRILKGPLVLTEITEDAVLDLLTNSGIEFYSLSAMYDVAEKIIEAITVKMTPHQKEGHFSGKEMLPEEMEPMRHFEETVDEDSDIVTEESAAPQEDTKTRPRPTKVLKEIELPYTGGHRATIKETDQPSTYCIILSNEEGKPIDEPLFISNPDEDSLIELLASTSIDFVSISALSDSAELILETINKATSEETKESSEDAGKTSLEEEYLPAHLEQEWQESSKEQTLKPLDISEIHLPVLDHLKEPEDFETYINEMNKALSENQPILVAEISISGGAPGSKVKIYRQEEHQWYMSFSAKNVPESKLYPLKKVDLDEVARLMNDHVPQISMSALVEQAEKVFEILDDANQRPREDMVINQAVTHFAKILEENEASGNLEKATRLAILLLNKFRQLNNPNGLVEFGIRLTNLLERQGKTQEAASWIIQIFEDLLKIGHKTSLLSFASHAIEWLSKPEIGQYLESSRFAREIYQIVSSEEDPKMSECLKWLEVAANNYCKARITVAVIDLGITESLNLLDRVHESYKIKKNISKPEFLEFVEKLTHILSASLNYLEENAEIFEIIDSYRAIIDSLEKYKLHEQLLIYAERAINFYKEHNLTKQMRELSHRLARELMTKEHHQKAVKFTYLTIQLMHKEKENPQKIMQVAYETMNGLLQLKLTKEALKYIEFIEQLASSLFSHDREEISLMYEHVASLLLEYDLADHANIYLQKMIEAIKIPEEVIKRIFKFIEKLMSEDKIKNAQNLVNFEIARQMQLGNLQDVAKVSHFFTKMLLKYKHWDLAFDYLKYTYQCYYQINDVKPAMDLFSEALPIFIAEKKITEARFLIDYIVQYYLYLKDETRAIDSLRRFLDLLIENNIQKDVIEEYIFKTSKIFEDLGDIQGSISCIIEYRDLIQRHDIALARKLTEEASKRLIDHYEDYNQAIDVLKPLVYQFLDKNDLENAYLYLLQVVGYYELAGDHEAGFSFLEEVMPKLLEKGQTEINIRLLDFAYRQYLKFNRTKEALTHARNLLKVAETQQKWEEAIEAIQKIVSVLTSTKKFNEATSLLDRKIKEFIQIKDPTLASKLTNLIELLTELLQEHQTENDRKKYYLSLSKQLIDQEIPELAAPVMERYLDLEKKKHPDEAISYLSQQINHLITKNHPNVALRMSIYLLDFLISLDNVDTMEKTVLDIVKNLLDYKYVSSANQLMEKLLSQLKEDHARIIRASLSYVKLLIKANLVSHARSHVEKIISDLTSRPDFQANKDLQLIVARILERFSMNLKKTHPELYIEYAYRAASQYFKAKSIDKTYQIFIEMANSLPPLIAEKALKRGIRLLGPVIEAQPLKLSLQLHLLRLYLKQEASQSTLNDTVSEITDTLLQTNDVKRISEEFAQLFANITSTPQKEKLETAIKSHLITIKKKFDEQVFMETLLREVKDQNLSPQEIKNLQSYLTILRPILTDKTLAAIHSSLSEWTRRMITKPKKSSTVITVASDQVKPDIADKTQLLEADASVAETSLTPVSLKRIKENLQTLKKDVPKTATEGIETIDIPNEDHSLISSIEEDEEFIQETDDVLTNSPLQKEDAVVENLQRVVKDIPSEIDSLENTKQEPQDFSSEQDFLKAFEEAITRKKEEIDTTEDIHQAQEIGEIPEISTSETADQTPKKEREKVIKEALDDLNELIKD